ncbi:amidohydrolase [Thioclava dalianensis]|uniref:Amidohydrolase n=1 Tax=Thioclava dalianensis TaxID=1185766 RepID=A0A074TKD9_9RHOB|nr:carbon-nitrogen hydrolase family protein [Thioclava dalianensis]KEP70630.1 amidohydrolase [Thioclava dalianensis]SFN06115.1 aliphatic nitrilase [Thioclava dalianensis]
MTGPTKVAAVQAAPIFMNLDASIDKAIGLIEEAAAQGVNLIAFPETYLPGYPWYIWLDAPAMTMHNVPVYAANSITEGSPQDKRLAEAARANKIHVVMGLSWNRNGTLYIAQWHYGPDGKVLSRRRKLKATHVERTVYGEGDGSDMKVYDTDIGRVGALCCWEHLHPLNKYAMFAQNEQIHIGAWPSFSVYEGGAYALGPEVNTSASRMYAVEGQCFVIAPCATVSDEMIEVLCDTPVKQQLLKKGGGYARIFAPDGSPMGENLAPDEEGLVIADIDLNMIAIGKAAADPCGHYSRPDVFRLMVNNKPAPVVMAFDNEYAQPVEAFDAEAEDAPVE